ncbi:MAG: hypothetical protein AAF950_09115 [Pseudomonadota bacterium]
MTHLKRAGLCTAAVFAISLGSATAETTSETFASMDANTDGLVSEAEFVSYSTTRKGHTLDEASAKFASIAGDDGLLSLAELLAVMPGDVTDDTSPGRS